MTREQRVRSWTEGMSATTRLFVIDAFSTIIFSAAVATFSELVVAGMDRPDMRATRLLMVSIMIGTARP